MLSRIVTDVSKVSELIGLSKEDIVGIVNQKNYRATIFIVERILLIYGKRLRIVNEYDVVPTDSDTLVGNTLIFSDLRKIVQDKGWTLEIVDCIAFAEERVGVSKCFPSIQKGLRKYKRAFKASIFEISEEIGLPEVTVTKILNEDLSYISVGLVDRVADFFGYYLKLNTLQDYLLPRSIGMKSSTLDNAFKLYDGTKMKTLHTLAKHGIVELKLMGLD